MIKLVVSMLLLFSFFFVSRARSISYLPQPIQLFKLNDSQNVGRSCSYTVSIKTSCSSPRYTRDQISLAFGDAYGNQVYAPRIDDPYSKTFEGCSTDTFEIRGPCTYQICYVYLYRSGYDGWKPDSVTIYAYHIRSVTFNYGVPIPNGLWYGFNHCSRVLASKQAM